MAPSTGNWNVGGFFVLNCSRGVQRERFVFSTLWVELSPLNFTLDNCTLPKGKRKKCIKEKKKKATMTVTRCCAKSKEQLQEHPDLSSTSFYSKPSRSPCSISSDTASIPASLAGGRRREYDQGRHCLTLGPLYVCVLCSAACGEHLRNDAAKHEITSPQL